MLNVLAVWLLNQPEAQHAAVIGTATMIAMAGDAAEAVAIMISKYSRDCDYVFTKLFAFLNL